MDKLALTCMILALVERTIKMLRLLETYVLILMAVYTITQTLSTTLWVSSFQMSFITILQGSMLGKLCSE